MFVPGASPRTREPGGLELDSTDPLNRDPPELRGAPAAAPEVESPPALEETSLGPHPRRAEGPLEQQAKQPAAERAREARGQQPRGRKTPKRAGTAGFMHFFFQKRHFAKYN